MISTLWPYFVLLAPGFGVAVGVAWLLVHTEDWHLHLTGDRPEGGPQKLHTEATARIGGLAVMAGLVAGLYWLHFSADPALRRQLDTLNIAGLMAAFLPLFLLGLAEDIFRTVSIRLRFGVSLVAGVLAYGLAGVRIEALGLPVIDPFLLSLPLPLYVLALPVTVVAVAGLVHAMNIVDGLNGLLAGISLVVLGALAAVSARFGETALMLLALATMAATAGFAVFNFPRARLFCGDAGAYLLGYMVSTITILLVLHQPAISPWFALAVIIHPVTETLYSAWRRHRLGLSPTAPDARHMHSLWAARLRRRSEETGQAVWLGTNAGASLRTLAVASVPTLLAACVPTHALALQALCVAYVVVFIKIEGLLAQPSGNACPADAAACAADDTRS